jgi:hypothetical protein
LQLTVLQAAAIGAPLERVPGAGFGVHPNVIGRRWSTAKLEAKAAMQIRMGFGALLALADGLDGGRIDERAAVIQDDLTGEGNPRAARRAVRGRLWMHPGFAPSAAGLC